MNLNRPKYELTILFVEFKGSADLLVHFLHYASKSLNYIIKMTVTTTKVCSYL